MANLDGEQIAAALLLLVLLTWLGTAVRDRVSWLGRLFIPGSLVAGAIGLIVGPEVAGRIVGAGGLWPDSVTSTWSELPGLLIAMVFATLFLGEKIPSPRTIWRMAGPQVAFAQTMAWGQYVVGLLLALLVLGPVFSMPAVSGTLIEIGYEGGHGTSAGMSGAFDAADFPQGTDLALGLATIGVVSAVLIGVAFVNWAVRTGRVDHDVAAGGSSTSEEAELDEVGDQPHLAKVLLRILAAAAAAILLGWLMLEALRVLERTLWIDSVTVVEYMPLFPFAMIGGIAIQVVLMKTGQGSVLDPGVVAAIRRLSLDLLIAAAVATLSLTTIAADILPFLLLAITGIAWVVFALIFLAPRMLPDWWVERAVTDIGQSLGMTASGLLLLRIVDPKERSPVLSAFGYKQLFFEPVVGGGVFTAASVPLVFAVGGWPILALVTALMLFWLILGLRLFGTRRTVPPSRGRTPG